MKPIFKQLALPIILGLALPGIAVGFLAKRNQESADLQTEESTEQTTTTVMISKTEWVERKYEDTGIPVLINQSKVQMIGLEDYLTGVLLAEIPASFDTEALKAQAVVARTYVLRRYLGENKHLEASVCVESGCCQGYITPEDYISNGGEEMNVEKMRLAVQQTAGSVLCYEGDLIDATYFSCSGGKTEDAVAVWGLDIPYLQSTESPGEENAVNYEAETWYSVNELEELLNITIDTDSAAWIGTVTRTEGGGVANIDLCGQSWEGAELRKALGLKSTNFDVEVSGNGLLFRTSGYGHRVGMSQYGADAMAKNGADYEQILKHYYHGVQLDTADIPEN